MNDDVKVDLDEVEDSMDVVASAMSTQALGSYATEDGKRVAIRKATVQDSPVVLKVFRSLMTYVNNAKRADADETEFAINFIEDNLTLVLQVVESVTDLSKAEVDELVLSDFIAISLQIWELNQAFFIQVMQLVGLFRGSTPPAPQHGGGKRKRARK